ncbi:hypothetical protein B0H19DRAFT_1058582 [Mycena capillaripes]|nr:hypothetical protein B0H19DRAFT_1058582 [Mycena capillaripes]
MLAGVLLSIIGVMTASVGLVWGTQEKETPAHNRDRASVYRENPMLKGLREIVHHFAAWLCHISRPRKQPGRFRNNPRRQHHRRSERVVKDRRGLSMPSIIMGDRSGPMAPAPAYDSGASATVFQDTFHTWNPVRGNWRLVRDQMAEEADFMPDLIPIATNDQEHSTSGCGHGGTGNGNYQAPGCQHEKGRTRTCNRKYPAQ